MTVCEGIRMSVRAGFPLSPEEEQHLFGCPTCRRRSKVERVEREIDGLSTFAAAAAPVPGDFVARVMRGLPALAGRSATAAPWLWAAALAIFSAAAGYGYSVWADSVAAGQQVTVSSPSAPSEDVALLNF